MLDLGAGGKKLAGKESFRVKQLANDSETCQPTGSWCHSKVNSVTISRRLIGRFQAHRLATTSKRLDICAAQFAFVLHAAGIRSIKGWRCLEVGSGWVLTHSVIMYLLGASAILGTDLEPLAHPESLRSAIHASVKSVVRDILAPYEDHSQLRTRLDNLISTRRFSFRTLAKLGINYVAPFDPTTHQLPGEYDFVYSNAVLEHVPAEDLRPLLQNLVASVAPGGIMIHCIHLEDHHDIERAPLAFLAADARHFGRGVQASRGNRVRSSGWRRIFASLTGVQWRIIYEWHRKDVALPPRVDPSIAYTDEEDLRASHIGVVIEKSR